MAWERTCVRKESGGMGFRDLRGFNLAMLGKQGWKFQTQPDALVTKIFKARYFPRWDFLSAPPGHGPSYVWQSIRRSQQVVGRGSRWRVGNGTNIRVWDDHWLRNGDNLGITTARDDTLEGLKVCDLLIPGLLEWDRELVEALFDQRDVLEILSVPIGVGGIRDELIWHFDPKGAYSVRSAYRVLMESSERVQRILQAAQLDSRDKASTVLWGIWNERNRRVWRNESCTAGTAMKLALDDVKNWSAVQTPVVPHAHPAADPCGKWHAPPFGSLKCNSDVGFQATTNEMGMGIILRDCDGRVIGYKQWHDVGQWTPREGEAAALLSAMSWVVGIGYEDVIFECDAEAISQALASDEDDLPEFGCIIYRCRELLASFPRFRVQVVRRNRNQVAHLLARQSFSLDISRTSYSPPNGMDNILYDVCFNSNH
ncbi:Uncharacterized mitochondrial protein AtMg00310 [Linum perenne]